MLTVENCNVILTSLEFSRMKVSDHDYSDGHGLQPEWARKQRQDTLAEISSANTAIRKIRKEVA